MNWINDVVKVQPFSMVLYNNQRIVLHTVERYLCENKKIYVVYFIHRKFLINRLQVLFRYNRLNGTYFLFDDFYLDIIWWKIQNIS